MLEGEGALVGQTATCSELKAEDYSGDCRGCHAVHISNGLAWRKAARAQWAAWISCIEPSTGLRVRASQGRLSLPSAGRFGVLAKCADGR